MTEQEKQHPREDLVRGVFPALLEIREESSDATGAAMPTMEVNFARYNEWSEINSAYEGNFMERIAPGAFKKTMKENSRNMRVLFNHGSDPSIGDKVLGPITDITDGEDGPRATVPLLDTSYNRDLLPGLRAGLYGSSFRFAVKREDWNDAAKRSDYNPKGLPERTINEASVREFGPVTFPAYAGATAGVRSLTDALRRAELVPFAAEIQEDAVPEEDERGADAEKSTDETEVSESEALIAAPPHPEPQEVPRRDTQPVAVQGVKMMSIEEMLARQGEIRTELEEIAAENRGNLLSNEDQSRWDALATEDTTLKARVKAEEERTAYLAKMRGEERTESGHDSSFVNITRPSKDKAPDNPFEMEAYHGRASSQEHLMRMYTDGARRALEGFEYADYRTDEAAASTNMERVLARDTPDREVARRVLTCGSPTYRRAFGKYIGGSTLTSDEQRALGIGSQGGQLPVPIQIDPTVTLVSNGVVNPLRRIARKVTMTGYEWRGVTTQGVTSSYGAEASVSSDNSPTLIQPTIDAEQAKCFVPFSYESGQDWAGLESELGSAIADSKDVLEATMFLTGAGHASNQPRGVLRASATVTGTAANTVFSVADIYALEAALPPRFRPNASFLANRTVFQRIRQFDTAGGASLWVQLQNANPPQLIGYNAYEMSTMSTAAPASSGGSWAIFGDFSQFIIADRIGMSIELIPNLFNGNTAGGLAYPTGQRGLFAFWRNSADVTSSNAFRVGTQT